MYRLAPGRRAEVRDLCVKPDGVYGHREEKGCFFFFKKRRHRFISFGSGKKKKFHVMCTNRKQIRNICTEMLTTVLTCETTGHFCLLCFLYVLNLLPRKLCTSLIIKEKEFYFIQKGKFYCYLSFHV